MKVMKPRNSWLLSVLALGALLMTWSDRSTAEDHPHATPAPAQQTTAANIKEYKVATPYSFPYGIAVDSKGKVWFTEQAGNRVGFLDPLTEKIEEMLIPSAKGIDERAKGDKSFSVSDIGSPTAITVAPDDSIWFVQRYGNVISRLDPVTREFQTFAIPTPQSAPHGIVVAKDGAVWFTERNGNKIGHLDPVTKKIREFPVPSKNGQPAGIALDAAGNVWFAESEGNAIGKLEPATGKFTEYPLLTAFANPSEVAVDDKGNVWFTLLNTNSLGMLRANTTIFDQATIPTFASVPMGIVLDQKGRVWFTQTRGNKIALFDPTIPLFKEFAIPTTNSLPTSIALDAAGNVWFTENDRDANKIGMLPASEIAAALAPPTSAANATKDKPAPTTFTMVLAIGGMILFGVFVVVLSRRGKSAK